MLYLLVDKQRTKQGENHVRIKSNRKTEMGEKQ